MKTHLMVTITCPDRPGIVERVTEVIESFSANWEESRMARLGGDFAGIVRVSVPAEKILFTMARARSFIRGVLSGTTGSPPACV